MKQNESFFQKVYEVVRKVPRGRVTTYGLIATYLGSPGAARMVGWAMNVSHQAYPPVPAHRVVNRNGYLTGKMHFPAPDMMEKLLEGEGIKIVNDRIVNFKQVLWNPMTEINE